MISLTVTYTTNRSQAGGGERAIQHDSTSELRRTTRSPSPEPPPLMRDDRDKRARSSRQSNARPADQGAAAPEHEDEPAARYELLPEDAEEKTMRRKLKELQGKEWAAYLEALLRHDEDPAAVKPGACTDPYGNGLWRAGRRTSSKHPITDSELENLPRLRARKVAILRREHLDICLREDRRDVMAALRDLRKDVISPLVLMKHELILKLVD